MLFLCAVVFLGSLGVFIFNEIELSQMHKGPTPDTKQVAMREGYRAPLLFALAVSFISGIWILWPLTC